MPIPGFGLFALSQEYETIKAARGGRSYFAGTQTNFTSLPANRQNLPDLPATVTQMPRPHKKARIRFKKKRLALRVAILSAI